MNIPNEFVCTECQHCFVAVADSDGFYKGYTTPNCPICGERSTIPNDYGDFYCDYCKKTFRKYGNGGLTLGCIPNCPFCHDSYMVREMRLYI